MPSVRLMAPTVAGAGNTVKVTGENLDRAPAVE